ncbi:MAG: hypothetical protein MR508_07095 [Lachnospiraceae bacterium]|nr:hypothetical protein [Lachnospiraceae bacterium]
MTIGTGYGNYRPYNFTTQNYHADEMPQDSSAFSEAQKNKPASTDSTENTKRPDSQSPVKNADPDKNKKPGRRSSPEDCETCKTRKYQDGSDESNVSFKSAAHISPQSAGAAVRAHENEHVTNAYNKASKNNGKVLSATVSIHTAICPECGRSYVSGGTTNTMIKYTNEDNPYQKELKAYDTPRFLGANIDLAV